MVGDYLSATEIPPHSPPLVSCPLLLPITLVEGVKQTLLKSLERNMKTHLEITQVSRAEYMVGSAMTLLLVLVQGCLELVWVQGGDVNSEPPQRINLHWRDFLGTR